MAIPGKAVIRGRQVWGRHLPRITAALIAVLAVLVVAEMVAAAVADLYAVALVGTVVAGALVTAVRLWSTDSFELRLATGGLAGVVLMGQVVVSVFGSPGDPGPGWTPAGVAVALVALAVLTLVAVVSLAPCRSEGRRHPYAL